MKLSGKLTIPRAYESVAAISQVLAEAEHGVVLDLSEVTGADVTFLQILCAAHRSALREGKSFSIAAPSRALLDTVRTAGFERTQPCTKCTGDACLWQSKEAA